MRKLFALAVAVLLTTTAMAQLSATVEHFNVTNWTTKPARFHLTDVAQALETDTATLCAAIDDWYAGGRDNYTNEDTRLFGVLDSTGTDIDTSYDADGRRHNHVGRGSYWFNADGSLGINEKGSVYNNCLEYDRDADLFIIPLGHHPETGDSVALTAQLHFVMRLGGHEATFAITYTVLPVPVAAEPQSLVASGQNVVGGQTVVVNRTTLQGYEGTTVTFDADKLASALGLEAKTMGVMLPQLLYMQQCDVDYMLTDSLTRTSTAGAPGWWTKRTFYPLGHEQAGEPSPYLGARKFANDDDVFVETFKYNEDDNTITALVGQIAGQLADGDDLLATVYAINADRAYTLTVNVKVAAPIITTLEELTEVGNLSVQLEQVPTDDYASIPFTVNLDSIATLLGTEAANVQLKALADELSFWPDQPTALNGGYWFDRYGYVHKCEGGENGSWFYIEPTADQDFSSLRMGQYPNDYQPGDSAVADLFYVYDTQYVRLHVVMNIIEPELADPSEWQLVSTRTLSVTQTANAGHLWSNDAAVITASDLEATIGTAAPKLYGEVLDEDGNVVWTDTYTMGEKPGFWLDKDGYSHTYGTEAPWGITCQAATTKTGADWGFKTIQRPGEGLAGKHWSGNFYLLNTTDGRYIKVNLTCRVVPNVGEKVGEENLYVPVTIEGVEIPVDWEKIATALGTTIDVLCDTTSLSAAGSAAVALNAGLNFMLDGSIAPDGENGDFAITYETEESIFCFSNLFDEVDDDWSVQTDIYIIYNDKQYTLHTTFLSQQLYTPVTAVRATKSPSAVYDLSGRRVEKTQKGVYILDGHKVIVK